MYKASAGVLLPTSIIGSLPRPAWHTVQLGSRTFLEAMVNGRWREQYEDAVSTHLRAQEVAGLDICTDGDAHYDEEIGGWSWQSYPLTHMAGFSREVALTPPAVAATSPPRGAILHDQLEARVFPPAEAALPAIRSHGPTHRQEGDHQQTWLQCDCRAPPETDCEPEQRPSRQPAPSGGHRAAAADPREYSRTRLLPPRDLAMLELSRRVLPGRWTARAPHLSGCG